MWIVSDNLFLVLFIMKVLLKELLHPFSFIWEIVWSNKEIKIDPFVGCCIQLPDWLSDGEYDDICKSMIWKVLNIDDTREPSYYEWWYIPLEWELISIEDNIS